MREAMTKATLAVLLSIALLVTSASASIPCVTA